MTPGGALMMDTRAKVGIPIFVMVRPRAGDFVYSSAEFAAMRETIGEAKRIGMDGVVLGMLTEKRRVDVERTKKLVELARGMEVTFHRAIDEAADFGPSVEAVIATGARRILTSGGKATALEGADAIRESVTKVGERIVIVPGAGINPENVGEVARRTGAKEFHSGLSSVLKRGVEAGRFEAQVRRLQENLRGSWAAPAQR